MGNVIHTPNGGRENDKCCSVPVDADIVRELVVGALEERAVNTENRLCAEFCECGAHCNCVFFCDADIDKLLSCEFTLVLGEAHYGRSSCCECNNGRVFLHLAEEIISGHCAVIFTVKAESIHF